DVVRYLAACLEGGREELRGEDVPQRVTLELTPDQPVIPVNVLEHAVGVVGHPHSHRGLEALTPRLREIPHGELPLEEIELQIEAENDVEAVRGFVGVGADERSLHAVDGAIERVHAHRVEIAAEDRLHPREEVLPEAATPPDEVLPQAGLALVHAR